MEIMNLVQRNLVFKKNPKLKTIYEKPKPKSTKKFKFNFDINKFLKEN